MKKPYGLAVGTAVSIFLGVTCSVFAETSSTSAQVLIIIPERPDLASDESPSQQPSQPAPAPLETAQAPAPSFATVIKTFQPGQTPRVTYTYTDFN